MPKKEKIKEVLDKPLIFALIQNCICLLLSVFAFHPHFEENDDVIIAFIAEGVYGARDSHLVYANYCLGDLLKCLYQICPDIRWHSMLQYVFLLLGFTAVSYILIREKKHGKLLSTLFLLCTFYEAYVSLQYTKTAAIVSVSGYMILLYGLRLIRRGERSREGFIMASLLLLAYGFTLRSSSFYLATAVFLLPITYEIWSVRKETETGHQKKLLIAYLTCFAALAVVIVAFWFIDRTAYTSQKDWNAYTVFNEKRMELLDYRYDLMDYDTHGEELEAAGISENDALLYLTWQFADSGVFNMSLMNQVLEDAAPRSVDMAMFKRMAEHLYEEVYGLSALVLGAIGLIVWLFLSRDRKNYILLAYVGIVLAAVLFYYEYSGRWNHRVVIAVFFATFMLLIQYGTNGGQYAERKPLLLMIGICIFLNMGLFLKDSFAYNDYMRGEAVKAAEFNAYTMENEGELFLIDPFTDQQAYRYDVFKSYPEGAFENCTYFGGWLARSPIYSDVLERFGYHNVFQALKSAAADERIYLVDDHYPEQKLQYLEEHYGKSLTLERVETLDGYAVYRLCK